MNSGIIIQHSTINKLEYNLIIKNMIQFAKELDNSAEINQNLRDRGLTNNQIVLRDK